MLSKCNDLHVLLLSTGKHAGYLEHMYNLIQGASDTKHKNYICRMGPGDRTRLLDCSDALILKVLSAEKSTACFTFTGSDIRSAARLKLGT